MNEICAYSIEPQILLLGPKKFIVKNDLSENTFTCRFNFITTLKGIVEINIISVFIYKKSEMKGGKFSIININHIIKLTSVFIE
jgi:hypothetical protein